MLLTKSKIIIGIGIVVLCLSSSHVYAADLPKLTQLERGELFELRKAGNREKIRFHLEHLKVRKGERPYLSEEQRERIKELRKSQDRELMKQRLRKWREERVKEGSLELPDQKIFKRHTIQERSLDVSKKIDGEKRKKIVPVQSQDKEYSRVMRFLRTIIQK